MLPRVVLLLFALLVAACGSRDNQHTPLSPTPFHGDLRLTSSIGQPIDFPPRNEPFDFRNELERKYRDGLRRSPNSTFVDLEGDVVWTQEYLRYRVNQCDHATAIARVFDQIDGREIAPACGAGQTGTVAFPPRQEPFDFRQQLERKYRDQLQRPATQSFADLEGAIVWTQEYLRYRVNSCGHLVAVTKVFDQIDGRAIGPVCRDTALDLTGVWTGTSNYFNAPFTMDLRQTGTIVSGSYQDRHDRGSVAGEVAPSGQLTLDVNFGDAGIRFSGAFDTANRVKGTFRVSVVSGTFTFEMLR